MKIGRNDPCPCGSGKKYKHCCLAKQAEPSQTLYYRRLSEAYNRLSDRLVPYAARKFGNQVLEVAMEEFLLRPEPNEEEALGIPESLEPLFWPWFLFNWEYDSSSARVKLPGPEGLTVAEVYAKEQAKKLDPLQQRLIENINRKPYTFLEVEHVDPGEGMRLKDILKASTIEVQERLGSKFAQAGDLVFGRAVSVDGVGMIVGLSSSVISPGKKPDIIQLRTRLQKAESPVTDQTLKEWDKEIRKLFLAMDHALNSMPKLCNTDGDPMEFHRVVYEVPSAEEAFEKLHDLCVTVGAEELREDAKRDGAGRIERIEFPWDRLGHKLSPGMPNTVLGRITIDGRRLMAEVNSAQRAKHLRREIESRMGPSARFRLDEIQDIKTLLDEGKGKRPGWKSSQEQKELMESPELREHLSRMLTAHWEGWVDQKIPALGGKSPREAANSPDGREAVEALLREAEKDRGDPFMAEANRKGARRARELLGFHDP